MSKITRPHRNSLELVSLSDNVSLSSSAQLPHVYLPRLHRQTTEKVARSKLSDALMKMVQDGGWKQYGDNLLPSAVEREVHEFVDWILPHLNKNKNYVKFKHPLIIETFPSWKVREQEINCLIPISISKLKFRQIEPGFVAVKLPKIDLVRIDKYSYLRSEDTTFLSARQIYKLVYRIIKKTFRKQSIPLDRLSFTMRDDSMCILYEMKNYGYKLELIPAIHYKRSNALLVSAPVPQGANSLGRKWRICWSEREIELIQSISRTDKGLRVNALNIVYRLCQKDFRLCSLTPYQLQTVMLYDVDHQVDNSPRWQRSTLEECVQSLLSKLLTFVKEACLPHFIIDGYNLFNDLTAREIILYQSALERIATNQRALLKLIERKYPLPEDTLWLDTDTSQRTAPEIRHQLPPSSGLA